MGFLCSWVAPEGKSGGCYGKPRGPELNHQEEEKGTTGSSFGSSLKYSLQGGVRTWHAGIWSPEQYNFEAWGLGWTQWAGVYAPNLTLTEAPKG